MESPFTGGKARLEKESMTMEYRKESFDITYHYYVCEDTGEQFTNDEIDTLNQNQVLNRYRAKYGIPNPEEIKLLKSKYGLSSAKMSIILGLGANGYRNFENGEMPSASIGKYLRLAEDPHEFLKLINLSKDQFSQQEYEDILKKAQSLVQRYEHEHFVRELELDVFPSKLPNINNGFRVPSLPRVGYMIQYLVKELNPFTTLLNKLLFYADFDHFKHQGSGISGIIYKAYKWGPVPTNYGGLYNIVCNNQYVEVDEVAFPEYAGNRFCYKKDIDMNEFRRYISETEQKTLDKVISNFKSFSTAEIVEKSHEEAAWLKNQDTSSEISYEYSFDLKNID
ncbi:Protein of unknown function [Chitinophaga eiseniae]|uniref:Antitoxin SocA-like Panacea domain-containing protein n=1 Tax=Chitinophaga eiseniae TaxID=634771 RepID=A0A1T4LAD1_9BACT|nr:type II toxin-antitoxin system antitoxin SocA domain-containing protein [Chitinophaga eiseniae]SJZ51541.1 Protein of unknown function [Chitinophaga eiseniae]